MLRISVNISPESAKLWSHPNLLHCLSSEADYCLQKSTCSLPTSFHVLIAGILLLEGTDKRKVYQTAILKLVSLLLSRATRNKTLGKQKLLVQGFHIHKALQPVENPISDKSSGQEETWIFATNVCAFRITVQCLCCSYENCLYALALSIEAQNDEIHKQTCIECR